MTDDNTAGQDHGEEFKAITSQADLDRIIGDRLARERGKFADYDELKAKAAKLDEHEQASKSEVQKAIERAEAAEKRAAELEAKDQRAQWAAEIVEDSAVPASALRGSTRAELEEHFAVLKDLIKPQSQTRTSTPPGKPASGAGEKGRAAAALRELRKG